jgi:hypothetical protein
VGMVVEYISGMYSHVGHLYELSLLMDQSTYMYIAIGMMYMTNGLICNGYDHI